MKRCKGCGKRKALREFRRHNDNGRRPHCNECLGVRYRAWSEVSKRWVADYCRRWRQKNEGIVDSASTFIDRAAGRGVKNGLTPYFRMRHAAILAYGGYRCACCGVDEPMFLTIDHLNNDGTSHRRQIGFGGTMIYTW